MANFLEQYQNNKSLLEEERKRKKASILNPNSSAYKENTKTEDFLTKYGASPSSNGTSSSDDDFLSKYLSADTKSIYEEMAKLDASSETETLQSESNGEKGLLQKIPYLSDALGGGIKGVSGVSKFGAEVVNHTPMKYTLPTTLLGAGKSFIEKTLEDVKNKDISLKNIGENIKESYKKGLETTEGLTKVADAAINYGDHFSTIDKDSGFIEKALKGAAMSAGQMAGSSIIPIPYAGLAMSSTGNAIHEGQEAGVKNPYLYGLINGTIETGSEMVLPGSKVLKGVYAGKGVKEAIKEVAKEFGEETVEQSLKTIAKTMAKEGAQEGLTEVAQGFAGNMFEDKDGNKMGFNSTEELVENILLAGTSGAIMGGVGDASAYMKSKSTTTDSETGIKSSIFDSKKKKEAQEIAKEAIKQENDNINNLLSTIRTETTETGEEVHVSENGNTINPVLMSAMTETYNEIYGIDINESIELNNKIAENKAQDEDLQWNSYLNNAETEVLQSEDGIQTENLQSEVDETKNINPNIKSVEEEVNVPITNTNSNAEISPVEKSLDNTDKVVSSQIETSSNEEIEALNTINNSINDEYVKENGIEKTISEIDTVINSIPNTKENETYINALNSKKTELAENYNQSKANLSENKETESKNAENNQNKKNSPEINENNGNLKELERVKNRAEKKLLNPKAKENVKDVKIEKNKEIEEVDNKSKTSEENKNKSKENEIKKNKENKTEEVKTESSSDESKLKEITESNNFKKHYEDVEIKPSNMTGTKIRATKRIAELLGKKVVFFESNNDSTLRGFTKGDTIYINDSDSVDAMVSTVGHETFHTLKESHTETFNELVKWGEENFTAKEIEDFLSKIPNQSLVEEYINNPSLLSEEMLAETFGKDLLNKKFWNTLEVKNKTLFEKIKDFIFNTLTKLKDADVDFLTQKHIEELRGKFVDVFGDLVDTNTKITEANYKGELVINHPKDNDVIDRYIRKFEEFSKNNNLPFLKEHIDKLNAINDDVKSELKNIEKETENLSFLEKRKVKKSRINEIENKYNASEIIDDAYSKIADSIPNREALENSLKSIMDALENNYESIKPEFTKRIKEIANLYGYTAKNIYEIKPGKEILGSKNKYQYEANLYSPSGEKIHVSTDNHGRYIHFENLKKGAIYHANKKSNNTIDKNSVISEVHSSLSVYSSKPKVLNPAKTVKTKKKTSKSELMALHNISEENLHKILNIGAFPSPSIGITKGDIPFEIGGEITLVGDKNIIDPSNKDNKVYNSDIYSKRMPETKTIPADSEKFAMDLLNTTDKNSPLLDDIYRAISIIDYGDSTDLANRLSSSDSVWRAVLEEHDIDTTNLEYQEVFDKALAMDGIKDEVYERIDNAIKNSDTKTVFLNKDGVEVESTIGNLLDYMKGDIVGSESKILNPGKLRALGSTELKSIEDIRNNKNLLQTSEVVEMFKNEFASIERDFRKELPKNNYSSDLYSAMADYLTGKETAKDALIKNGYKDIEENVVKKFESICETMKKSPVEYFEAKPQRAVDFSEFKGAVVPKGTSKKTIDALKKKGITDIKYYTDEKSRTEAVNSFEDIKFRDIAKTEEDKKVISKEVAKETFKTIMGSLDNYRLREAINKTLDHRITSKGNLKEILNDGAIDVAFNTDFSYGSRRGAIMAYLIQDHSFSVGDALAVANYITDLAEDTIMASNNIHGVPNHIAYKPKADETFEDKKMKVQAKFIDNLAAIKLVGDESYDLALLSRLNYGKIGNLFDSDVLVDMEGNVVLDYGWKTIDEDFKTGDSKEQIAYRNYLTFKSALERFNKGVPSLAKDDGAFYSSRELQFEIRNAELQYPRFIESSERLYKFMDTFGKEYIVKTGLMSEGEFKLVRMSDPSWVPFVRDGEEGISFGYGRSKKGLANQKAAIERIKGSKDSVQDVYGSLVGYIEKTVTSSMKNRAVQSIAHELLINPNLSEFGEVITNTNLVDLNDPNIITCMMDGQKSYLKINNEHLLNSLTSLDEMEIHKMLKPLEKMVKLFKSWTTSDNPLFAFTNTFKDHFTYLANSDTNLAKAEKYVAKAVKELATNGEMKQLYDRMGISGSHYTADSVVNKVEKMQKQKHIYKDGKLIDIVEKHPVLKRLDTFLSGVEKLNYNSEAIHRLAKFMMSIEEGKSVEQATLDAMEITTNFSRRGDYVKGLTLISPYVNAAIQGNVRKFNQFFTSKERTAQTLINLAIIGVITHALEYGLLDDDDKEKRKAISEYTRYSNYLIPVGNGKFAKIPKSREYGVMFDSIFEMISDKGFGAGITTALKMDYQNSAPDFQNFFLKPLLDTIGTNDNATDFLGRDIIPYDLKGLSSNRQIAEDTTMGSRIIGQLTSLAGISPVELDYLIDQYTGIVGDIYLTNGKISKGIDLITKKVSVNSDNYSPKRTEYYENKAVLTDIMKVLEQDGDEKTLEKVKKINSEYTKTNKKAKEYLEKGDKEKSEALYEKLNEKYGDIISEYKKESKNINTKLILNPKSKG